MSVLHKFIFWYPLAMAFFWISGAIIFFLRRELSQPASSCGLKLKSYPPVSILVPCYNEESTIKDTINNLKFIDYPNFEVIAVNDGSSDTTGLILTELAAQYRWLRVINLKNNMGKATCLNMGTLVSKNEYLICIDADALLDRQAVTWILYHLVNWPKVGAVTGNPRIRNRISLLGKIQVGEFSSIIGMIKRCQRIIGRLFTLSGVIAGFRKSALIQVGLWDTDSMTEDIDISWKLQSNFWDLRFEPRAICWTLMPETLRGFWKQRLRWARGGAEVVWKYKWILRSWKHKGMFLLIADYIASVIWAYCIFFALITWLLEFAEPGAAGNASAASSITQGSAWFIMLFVCLLQFAIGLVLDSRYEKAAGRYYYWIIWYPVAYWIVTAASILAAVPLSFINRRKKFATWESPDRGLDLILKRKTNNSK